MEIERSNQKEIRGKKGKKREIMWTRKIIVRGGLREKKMRLLKECERDMDREI